MYDTRIPVGRTHVREARQIDIFVSMAGQKTSG